MFGLFKTQANQATAKADRSVKAVTVELNGNFYSFSADLTQEQITARLGTDDWDYALVCS